MIIIRDIKLEKMDESKLEAKIRRLIKRDQFKYTVYRRSIDARKGILYNYQVLVEGKFSEKEVKRIKNAAFYNEESYELTPGEKKPSVCVVGFGPCGIFASYLLSKYGIPVTVIERGSKVEERMKKIDDFLHGGTLDENTNVQFGEGGAGTFSDGKLTSRSKDKRVREVLKTFVEYGAPSDILIDQKPHIGTDVLSEIIVKIRKDLVQKGVDFHFDTTMEDIVVEKGKITKILTDKGDFTADYYIFALGNSPRDTLFQLKDKISMSNKPFAVGYRIEHPQELIDLSQYKTKSEELPPASYQLSHSKENQRGVYTFCMCPGGYVVNSSSEEGRLCVNGMSYHSRDGENANSAIVCGIGEEVYGTNLLDGVRFQREIEEKAFQLGGGNYNAPVQRIEDYLSDTLTTSFGRIKPTVKPGYTMTNLNGIYPKIVDDYIKEALSAMGRKIKGFDQKDAVLTGVETRTSCAVRLDREDNMRSIGISNLYPCGEGAGYAGGIVSSAIDGLKAAEQIIENKE